MPGQKGKEHSLDYGSKVDDIPVPRSGNVMAKHLAAGAGCSQRLAITMRAMITLPVCGGESLSNLQILFQAS